MSSADLPIRRSSRKGVRAAVTPWRIPARLSLVSGAQGTCGQSRRRRRFCCWCCGDPDTPVWLAPRMTARPCGRWIAFHTGARVVEARVACDVGSSMRAGG